MGNNLKNIIFDWSGTLADDFNLSFISTKHTIKHFGGPSLTIREYNKYFELPVIRFYKRYLKNPSFKKIDAYYFDHFSQYAPKSKLFRQVPQILKQAKKLKLRLYIVSTVRSSLLRELCKKNKIEKYFNGIFGDCHNKEKFLPQICKKLKLNHKQTLFVGDTTHDVAAAKKTGILSGALLCGYEPEDKLIKSYPDFIWNDHKGLMKFIKNFNLKIPSPLMGEGQGEGERVIPTVGAMIFNKGKIFLIQTHKWSHTFGIPGGKIKKGEINIHALKREIFEETGMKLKNIYWVMTQNCKNPSEFYKPKKHFLLINYIAESTSQKFKLNYEAESGIWISPSDALRLNLNQPTKILLKYYLKEVL